MLEENLVYLIYLYHTEGIREKKKIHSTKTVINRLHYRLLPIYIKKNYLKLNGFDEKFNMYGEDVDLSIRAHQNLGMDCYYISNAKLWHYVSASYGVILFNKLLQK